MTGPVRIVPEGWLPDDAEILRGLPILHSGWELDGSGWTVRYADGRIAVVLMSHNSPYIADERKLLRLSGRYASAMTETIAAPGFVVGGLIVSGFALIRDVLRPKTSEGVFAAPSFALSSLGLTFAMRSSEHVAIRDVPCCSVRSHSPATVFWCSRYY